MSFACAETLRQSRYKDVLEFSFKNPAFREVYEYDDQGDLRFCRNGIRIVDLLTRFGDRYDSPIQITDTVQVTQRAGLLKDIFQRGAELAEYPTDKIQIHYAAKANFKGEVVKAALKEVNMETSGELDLYNFQQLWRKGFIPKGRKVICNGFKGGRSQQFDMGYAKRIIEAQLEGIDITPVLMQNELPFYQENVKKGVLDVGLRLKFGIVSNDHEQRDLVSRFGFDWEDLQAEAEKIKNSGNIKFTMLHAMVSAASEVSPDKFAKSALYAAEKYAILKQKYPTLTHLNLGGGIPAIDSSYNYNAFLVPYMEGIKEICRKYEVELPTIVVESGSFIATDAECLVFRVIDANKNTSDNAPWLTLGGNLTNIPDIWIQKTPWDPVAGNNANCPTVGVRFGDLTCDSNNVYPPKDQPNRLIVMPDKLDDLIVAIPGVGAYQDVISGVGSQEVFHCGLPEPIHVYLWEDGSITNSARPTIHKMSHITGFNR